MNTQEVKALVEAQIGDQWALTNHHGIDLRHTLVAPQKIKVIERSVRNGNVRDRLIETWLVLVERTETSSGYRIVFREKPPIFGLASEGFPNDESLVLCGWYGDFITTFLAM